MQLLSFLPTSIVIVVGRSGTVPAYILSKDGGESWTEFTLTGPAGTAMTTLNFAEGRFLAGTGTMGLFLETRDSGGSWTDMTVTNVTTGAISHANGQYLVHDEGGNVYTMPDGGSALTQLGTGAPALASSSLFQAGGVIYLLVQGNGLYYYDGATWTPVTGLSIPYAVCTDGGKIYVATFSSFLQLYSAAEGSTSFQSMGTTVVAGAPGNYMGCNGSTFVVPVGTAVQVSTDAGATWTSANVAPVTVAGVAFSGTRYVAASTNGTIYVSVDALTWTAALSGTDTLNAIAVNRAALYY